MQLIFETADDEANGNWVEAAVDHILVEEGEPISGLDDIAGDVAVKVFPNPFGQEATLSYEMSESYQQAILRVFNAFGQEVQRVAIQGQQGQVQLGRELTNGIYWVKLEAGGRILETVKMAKTE